MATTASNGLLTICRNNEMAVLTRKGQMFEFKYEHMNMKNMLNN